MPRIKREPEPVGDLAPVYQRCFDRAMSTLAERADPRSVAAHAQLLAEGLARPLKDVTRWARERADACSRREPIVVARWEVSRWFDLPENVWSFVLHPDGRLNSREK